MVFILKCTKFGLHDIILFPYHYLKFIHTKLQSQFLITSVTAPNKYTPIASFTHSFPVCTPTPWRNIEGTSTVTVTLSLYLCETEVRKSFTPKVTFWGNYDKITRMLLSRKCKRFQILFNMRDKLRRRFVIRRCLDTLRRTRSNIINVITFSSPSRPASPLNVEKK